MFERYIGIDYSGARTADARLPGLRVYSANCERPPSEIRPSPDARPHWSRRGLAAWLTARLAEPAPTIVGIDHGFSFPHAYFRRYGLADWSAFLDDFHLHWPTDEADVTVDDVRRGRVGTGGQRRTGEATWRRPVERRAGAKSVFHFDVPGSVAKSTHAGLPWLHALVAGAPERLHAWPFHGLDVPPRRSLVAEVYPSLWRDAYPKRNRTDDQHDAFVVAAWLRDTDLAGQLGAYLHPALDAGEAATVATEGWILGVS